MVLRITMDDTEAIQNFVAELSILQFQVLPREITNALKTADRALTTHIGRQMEGRTYAPLRPMTMQLRQLRAGKQLPKGIKPGAARKLWYRKRAPNGGSPDSSQGFGWTGVAWQAAMAPGKITGRGQLKVLTRDFRSKGKAARQRLDWWHFGTKTKVTPKMRGFLHAVGVHLKKTTTELKREPRPIYREGEAFKLAQAAIRERVDKVVAALDQAGFTGVRIIRQ